MKICTAKKKKFIFSHYKMVVNVITMSQEFCSTFIVFVVFCCNFDMLETNISYPSFLLINNPLCISSVVRRPSETSPSFSVILMAEQWSRFYGSRRPSTQFPSRSDRSFFFNASFWLWPVESIQLSIIFLRLPYHKLPDCFHFPNRTSSAGSF